MTIRVEQLAGLIESILPTEIRAALLGDAASLLLGHLVRRCGGRARVRCGGGRRLARGRGRAARCAAAGGGEHGNDNEEGDTTHNVSMPPSVWAFNAVER